jgi:hypothetical protein
VRRLPGAEAFARGPLVDAALYCSSALFALLVLGNSSLTRNRTWADFAWPTYAAGAAGAALLWAFRARIGGGRLVRAQALLAAGVVVGAVALPLGVEAGRRSVPARLHPYAASEVVVTEAAARRVLHGRDPYSTDFDSPELAGRRPSTAEHFPYLPGMVAFGVPRALVADTPWTDARLFFLLATAAAAAFALRRWRGPPGHRLRAFQVLMVLPTGAAALVTGGDDVPVLALCLLALALLDRGRETASAAAAAGAGLLKLTAWPLLLVLAARSRRGRAAFAAAGAVVVAAAAAGPGGFVDDVLLFPAGLTNLPSPAATTTLGSMMIAPVGESSPYRVALTLVLLAVAAAIAVAVFAAVGRRRSFAASDAAAAAALVLLASIVLAPVARAGYVVYPLDLFAWAVLLR